MMKSQQNLQSKTKRLRIFAGPNGSGKTTLATNLSDEGHFKLSVFVNADILEYNIRNKGHFDFSNFNLNLDCETFYSSLINGASVKSGSIAYSDLVERITILDNKLYYKGEINSYIAADICSHCREQLLNEGKSFIIETVFSHVSKLDFMRKAVLLGYKVYLYFISTDLPEVNVNRVEIRVRKGGHNVPKKKIISRYYKSLELLKSAIKLSHRAYMWDNSNKSAELFAEINQSKGKLFPNTTVPNWFNTYVLKDDSN